MLALRVGVAFDVIYFPEAADVAKIAYFAACHDENANEHLPTSPIGKIQLCQSVYQVTGDWKKVAEYLVSCFGASKRRNVSRWLACSREMAASVQNVIEARIQERGTSSGVKEGFLFQNVHIAPSEAQIRQKLPEEWQRAAFLQLWEMIDASGAPSIAVFETSVCQPLKYCQLWLAKVHAKYGEIAATHGALQKIQSDMMFSASMRRLVTQAIGNKQNLEKAIPDVKIVIDALDADSQTAKSASRDPDSPQTP